MSFIDRLPKRTPAHAGKPQVCHRRARAAVVAGPRRATHGYNEVSSATAVVRHPDNAAQFAAASARRLRMSHVDGFVAAVATANRESYQRHPTAAAAVFTCAPGLAVS
jgi:hypothetical protein